jgi:hypothetical protein
MFRAGVLRASAALFGFAAAVSFHDLILRPARPGQLPGFMTSIGYDAGSSFRFVTLLVILPFAFAFAMRPVARLLSGDDVKSWARNLAIFAAVAALWAVTLSRDPVLVIVPAALAIAAACLLRHFPANFRRSDVVLLPTAAAFLIALFDITDLGVDRIVLITAAVVLALRLIAASSQAFTLAPLALVPESHFFARDQRHFGWPAIAIVIVTPLILRFAVPKTEAWNRRLRVALAWVIYPIACYAYLSATSILSTEGKPRISIFEDGQHVVAAHEMMRGERPYRHIVPPHGLAQDALLDYAAMRSGSGTLGKIVKTRGTISGLNSVAQYFLGTAIVGSPAGGILTFFLAAMLGFAGGTFRALPALVTVATVVTAVRTRRPSLFAIAAAGVAASVLTSLDYGAYAAIATIAGILRFPRRRAEAARSALIGGGIAGIVALIALAVTGVLGPFLRTTLIDTPRLGAVYALTPFQPPTGLVTTHFIPDVVALFFDWSSYLYLLWVVILIFLVMIVAAPLRPMIPRRRARLEAFVVVAAFAVACGISYAERHHLYFEFVVPALLTGMTILVARAKNRALRLTAPVLAVLILALAHPTNHAGIVAWLRRQRGPIEAGFREVVGIPRARDAFFHRDEADVIEIANRYQARLAPGETYFDFTNRGLLYYLFDRDCPVRYIEVAFYEPEDKQREIIAAIERNPRIRAALVPAADDHDTVDAVPNRVRAPLVWQYLQTHFTPDFAEGDVVFWKRNR